MSLFQRPSENQAKLYIKGLEKGDMRIDAADKHKGLVLVTVGGDGELLVKGEAIEFLRSVLVSLPNSLVSYGYPHTIMVDKGSTLKVKSALWLILGDEERADLVNALEGEHEITIREFRTLTR